MGSGLIESGWWLAAQRGLEFMAWKARWLLGTIVTLTKKNGSLPPEGDSRQLPASRYLRALRQSCSSLAERERPMRIRLG